MKFQFLGTSDSAGIPVHNCLCEVCKCYRDKGSKNLSTSAYIEINNKIILLDCGIEEASNIFDGKDIRGVMLTHFHADHCLGLLRLRHSTQKISCFHPKDELGFADLFKHKHSLNFLENEPFKSIDIEGVFFTPIPLKHSKNTTGYLIEYKNKNLIYLTDCFEIPKKSMEFLLEKNIDFAFIDACYDEKKIKGNHLNYLQATKILDDLKVKNGYLIHGSHSTLEYVKMNKIALKYPYAKGEFSINI